MLSPVLRGTSLEKRVQSCNRVLVPAVSRTVPSKNIPVTQKASDAEPDATSSSRSHSSPVNPSKRLLLWKESVSLC